MTIIIQNYTHEISVLVYAQCWNACICVSVKIEHAKYCMYIHEIELCSCYTVSHMLKVYICIATDKVKHLPLSRIFSHHCHSEMLKPGCWIPFPFITLTYIDGHADSWHQASIQDPVCMFIGFTLASKWDLHHSKLASV